MCQITTSRWLWNLGRYWHTVLATRMAHLSFSRIWTDWLGRRSINWTSLRDFLGRLLLRDEFWTRFKMAYCWVQWIDRFSCCSLWILAWTIRSMLSPTNLQFNDIRNFQCCNRQMLLNCGKWKVLESWIATHFWIETPKFIAGENWGYTKCLHVFQVW